jgi:hypothetical protein
MIYCDGERDQFDEKDFLHLGGVLFKPYVHLKTEQIPAHFADGGLPVTLKEDEHGSGGVTIVVTNPVPPLVSAVRARIGGDVLREIENEIGGSLASGDAVTGMDAARHYAGLDWPQPIPIESNDPLGDQKKALYQAQLQVVTSKLQGFIDHDKAVRANDYPLHQAVFQAYIDVAKGQIDRSVTRTQFIATAAGAIGTVYTAVIGLSFGLGQPNHILPARGIAPAIFLGLAFALAAVYLAYITKRSQTLIQFGAASTERVVSLLPAQRLIEERNDFIQWVADTVVTRLDWLHAAVISLAIGILFLPTPFVAVQDWIVWVGVGLGIVVVCIPLLRYLYNARLKRLAAPKRP